jgi:hypothetical protein
MVRKIKDLLTQVIPDTIIVHWSYTHRKELTDFDLVKMVNVYWKEFYEKVRAPSWPDTVELEDFYSLPLYIQQEIKQVHYVPGVDRFDFDAMLEGAYDEDRQIYYSKDTEQQDTENTISCVDETQQLANQHGIKLIHSFIPQFAPENQMDIIMQHMKESGNKFVPAFPQLDLARDGHHYDIKTAQYFVSKLIHTI